MIAVILVFAFVMSLVINVIERMIIHHNRRTEEARQQEALAADKQE